MLVQLLTPSLFAKRKNKSAKKDATVSTSVVLLVSVSKVMSPEVGRCCSSRALEEV